MRISCNRYIARIACLAICAFVALLPPARTALARRELKTVRVGFFAFDGYHTIAEDGERGGYGYELLQRMAGYTDWRLEYVGYDKSWGEMQDMLERGEIDLLTSAQKTPEREQRFEFSERAIGTSSAILTVRAGDERYALTDCDRWSGIRVGMLTGNSRNAGFAAFAQKNGFTYRPSYFGTTAELEQALKAGGTIDAALTSNLRSIHGEWVVAQYDPSPFYAIVRKGDTALMQEVDAAITRMLEDEPEIAATLMARFYIPDSGDEIAFTRAERAVIAASAERPLVAVMNPDREPYSLFIDGEPSGVIGAVANEIIKRSGLRMRFLQPADREAYYRVVSSGEADIRFDARYDLYEAEVLGYRVTQPYLEIPIAKLHKNINHEQRSAAMLEGGDIAKTYADKLRAQGVEVVLYPNMDAAAAAVLGGACDVAYLYAGCAELAVQRDSTNQLAAESVYGFTTSYAVAVSAEVESAVYSIINKTVESIGPEHVEEIVRQYATYHEKPFSLVGYVYQNPFAAGGALLVALGVVGLVALVVHQSRKGRREYDQLLKEHRRAEALAAALASAERANAAKSQFLSRVNHEMRTPLNAIIGFMTLSRGADEARAESYRGYSEAAAKQLLAVINDVLDMSSIESGKMKLSRTPFDLKLLVRGLGGLFAPQCEQKGLRYEATLTGPVDEWLIGDPLRLNQILVNLLGNAVKFTEQGEVRLQISQHAVMDESVFVRFEVRDTGCGMSEELRQRLFKPFEQESAQTAQKYGGSGLGLSIVRSLVSMMEGAITVQSELGEGTTFVVDLPFRRCDKAQDIAVPQGVDHLRVLLVDDDPKELEYLSTLMDSIHVRHGCAQGGEEALRVAAQEADKGDPFGMCLTDWRMPGMSGVELTQALRERYGKDISVILVSAYEHYQAETDALNAGASMFLTKPLFPSSLFDLLSTLTGGGMALRESAMRRDHDFRGRRFLLAEDNAMNRMVATELLRKTGATCDVAEDGRIAVDKFLASDVNAYDAILMDIQMPNVSGFEATRLIRAADRPDATEVPIVALTANAFNEDVARSLTSGMNAHVAKPIDPTELFDALERVILQRRP